MSKSRIYLSSPHMGGEELELVKETFASNWIAPLGPQVDKFEEEFAEFVGGAPLLVGSQHGVCPCQSPGTHAAALSSGTAALHLALRWVGVKPGDEVICSSLTFSASANPIVYEGGRPVFIDSDRISWNMDPALLAEALENRAKAGRLPKAVILVHLYGQSADIDPIEQICARHGVPLIEDAAEALGAVYWGNSHKDAQKNTKSEIGPRDEWAKQQDADKILGTERKDLQGGIFVPSRAFSWPANSAVLKRTSISPGTRGLCGVFSFNGNKIITTSGGGMLVSNNKALIDKARFWATQSRDPAPHYQHSEIGFNYRLSNVLAAIGRGQLRVLEQRVEARRRNFDYYKKALGDLPGIEFMPEAPYGRCTRWLTCITINPTVAGTDRENVRLTLAEENIEARPVWKPLHLQPVFKDCAKFGGAVAEDLFEHGLCLPSGSNLTESDLQRVVDVVRKGFNH
ncbi:MAG: aminotransferase class I/II-fold pyridoxal phosphate-dependent enzyme [Opitutaceae bacterium]|nr:aminotransferase class I/II-fold pyridoxal phosphate-dependent enzyme [Opitutaceae bacterium]